MIYLDYAATTPLRREVLAEMMPYWTEEFGNPDSLHACGRRAAYALRTARDSIAELVGVSPSEVYFTSGGTEADNWAVRGIACDGARGGALLSPVEHAAVHVPAARFRSRSGMCSVGEDGVVSPDHVRDLLVHDGGMSLVCVMAVNNEIGVIQDIEKIGEMCRERGILFHVDATQAAGKIPLDMEKLKVDLMSLSAHKLYGPKGMGALYVRRKPRARIEAIIHGGGHERGMRSGTLATHQIVGMGEAYRLCRLEMDEEMKRIGALRDRLWKGLSEIEAVHVNGSLEHRAPFNLNVSFAFVEGEALMASCPEIAVSSGSACTSASLEPSYVLRALGIDDELAHSSIRFSLGRFTTEEEIDYTIKLIKEKVAQLREMSPLWEMYKEGVDMKQVKWTEH